MCLKEIGLCVWNMITILGSIVNVSWGWIYTAYGHFSEHKILYSLIMKKIFICALKFIRKMAMALVWIYKTSCTHCMFYILGEVGYSEKSAHLSPYSFNMGFLVSANFWLNWVTHMHSIGHHPLYNGEYNESIYDWFEEWYSLKSLSRNYSMVYSLQVAKLR